MSVYEDLKKTSERLEKEVLNWEIVLKCVRDSVRKQGIQQDLTGENVHQICSFLKDLGMVSWSSWGDPKVILSLFLKAMKQELGR